MNKLLTVAELADLLGMAPQTIYNRHCDGGSLPPCVKLGRALRFPEDRVAAWIQQQLEAPDTVHSEQRRPGRPTKAEQIAHRRGRSV